MTGRLLAAVATLVLLAGCTQDGSSDPAPAAAPASTAPTAPAATDPAAADDGPANAKPARAVPLRTGERRMTLRMPTAYTPSAPTGVGTDDYRCFLLDPHLTKDVFLTGTNVLPGNPDVVHHVILFRVAPGQVAEARAKDAATPGEGWTCFGGTGLKGDFSDVDDANWLGAWAPGVGESTHRNGYGVDLPAGSRIVMQVHYNLLAGPEPDVSAAKLRVAPASEGL